MVLLPCGKCCPQSRCLLVKFTDWQGDVMNVESDFAKGEIITSLTNVTSIPFSTAFFGTYSDTYLAGPSFSVVAEESLIRLTMAFSRYSSQEIVFERTGSHTLWDGDEVSLTLVSDTFTPTLPAANLLCVTGGGYGCQKSITQVGTVTLRIDANAVGSAGASCFCSCSPESYGLPYTTPDTYTLQFQNLGVTPNGPRSYGYNGYSVGKNDSLWNDGLTAPLGEQRWQRFVPSGPIMRERYPSPYATSVEPPNYRVVVPGCNAAAARLTSKPIVLRKASQGASNPFIPRNADYVWVSDRILFDPGGFVRYGFTRCKTYEDSSASPPSLWIFFEDAASFYPYGAYEVYPYVPYVQSAVSYWSCAWERKSYLENPQLYADLINGLVFKFGERDNPFATITAGGSYSPESYVQCSAPGTPYGGSERAGCNGTACPPTRATVTLQSTADFPFGGSYNVPVLMAGSGATFLVNNWNVTVSALLGDWQGNSRVCGCDAPYNITVGIGASFGGVYGAFKQSSWGVSSCHGSCLSGQFNLSNNGKGSFKDPNYNFPIDVPSSVSVTF